MYLRIKLFNNSEVAVDISTINATFNLEGIDLELDSLGNTTTLLSNLESLPSFRSTVISNTDSDFNGRVVNVGLETGNYIRFDIPFDNLLESATFTVTLSDISGETLFTNAYTLFGHDLGNNPNVGVTENPQFLIYLVEDVDGSYDPDDYSDEYDVSGADVVFSSFVAYRRPYTNEIYFANTSNSEGDRAYFTTDGNGNDIQIGSTDGFVCIDENTNIKQTISLFRYQITGDCGPRVLLPGYPITDTSRQLYNGTSIKESTSTFNRLNIQNLQLRKYDYLVDFNLYHNCLQCDDKCVVLGNETTAAIYLDFAELSTLRINDVVTYPYDTYRFRYELIDRTGRIESVEDIQIPFTYPYVFSVTDENDFKFIPQNTGDYIIRGEVYWYYNGQQIVECETSKSYTGKYWFEKVEGLTCNQPKISNLSLNDITVVVKKLNNMTNELDILQTDTITQLDTLEYSFAEDGVYTFTISNGIETFEHVHVNYCSLKSCIEEAIKERLCNSVRTYKNEREYYNLNGLFMMAYLHFMQLNEEYALNYAYTVLTPSTLQRLYNLQDSLDKALEFCSECSKFTSGKPYIDSNCNCYD